MVIKRHPYLDILPGGVRKEVAVGFSRQKLQYAWLALVLLGTKP